MLSSIILLMQIAATITEPYKFNSAWRLNEKYDLARDSGIDLVEYKLGLFRKLMKGRKEDFNFIKSLVPKTKHIPIIVTSYRHLEGDRKFDKNAYSEIKRLLELGVADYVDIELTTPRKYLKDVVKLVKKSKKEVIISWHEYEKTPSDDILERIYNKEIKFGADIPKMCPTANNLEDTGRVVKFVERKSEEGKFLCWPMGEEGRIGRILTLPLIPWGFAKFDGSSAPGQLSYTEMKYWRFLFDTCPQTHSDMMNVLKSLGI